MRFTRPERIVLPLRDLHELVAVPEFDPFELAFRGAAAGVDPPTDECHEDTLYEPGMEYLVSRLRGRRFPRHGQLVLELPPAQVQPDAAGIARRVIDHYCRHKAGCLALAAAIARSNAAPGSFGAVFTEGLTIVGWVVTTQDGVVLAGRLVA
jgi:hypothetical protein